MSSFVYGAVTRKREEGTTQSTDNPGLGNFVDVLIALVPAEALVGQLDWGLPFRGGAR